MMFISGGGFFTDGSGDRRVYGPGYFLDRGVILATLN